MKVLIDTDIYVDFLRNFKNSKKIFDSVKNEKIVGFFSVITEAELFSGNECKEPKKRKAVEELLSLTNRIKVDSNIAKRAGEIRRIYEVPLMDAIIAASAIAWDIALYSRNVKNFKKIKELKLEIPY